MNIRSNKFVAFKRQMEIGMRQNHFKWFLFSKNITCWALRTGGHVAATRRQQQLPPVSFALSCAWPACQTYIPSSVRQSGRSMDHCRWWPAVAADSHALHDNPSAPNLVPHPNSNGADRSWCQSRCRTATTSSSANACPGQTICPPRVLSFQALCCSDRTDRAVSR